MGAEKLETLGERRGRLLAQQKCHSLQSALDAVDLRITEVQQGYELTRLAFHAGIPMDQIKNMVVTEAGVTLKGQGNA